MILSILCIREQFDKAIDQKVIQMRARPMKGDEILWDVNLSENHKISVDTEIFKIRISSESKFDQEHDFIVFCR